MSTSPESAAKPDDETVSVLSHWLAYHIGNEELRVRLQAIGTEGFSAGAAEAVDELLAELNHAEEGSRGELEMLVRETLEAVALG